MKKYTKFYALLLALLLLVSCSGSGDGTEAGTEEFTPPAAPESFLDGRVSVSVGVGDLSLIADLLDAEEYIREYHTSDTFVTSLTIDPEGGEFTYSRSDSRATGVGSCTYRILRGGESSYSVSEWLKPEVSRNPFESNETFAGMSEVYAHYTGEELIGNLLAVLGDTAAPRQLSTDMLERVLGYSASSSDSIDITGRTRSISATFTCEELASMLGGMAEDESMTAEANALWRAFFDGDSGMPIDYRIRQQGDFALSMRLTADAKTNRVELADITAKGAGTLLSLVYDGSAGDIEISVKKDTLEADYSKKHEEGKVTTTLRAEQTDSAKQLKLTETDGAVYFASERTKDGKTLRSSVKYDSNTETYTLTGGDIGLTLTLADGTLTGEAKNTKTQKTAALTFTTETDENTTTHTLTHVGERDVTGAGVSFVCQK